jgi:hypothetical protein
MCSEKNKLVSKPSIISHQKSNWYPFPSQINPSKSHYPMLSSSLYYRLLVLFSHLHSIFPIPLPLPAFLSYLPSLAIKRSPHINRLLSYKHKKAQKSQRRHSKTLIRRFDDRTITTALHTVGIYARRAGCLKPAFPCCFVARVVDVFDVEGVDVAGYVTGVGG